MPEKVDVSSWPTEIGRYNVVDKQSPVAVCTLGDVDITIKNDVAISGPCRTENLGIEKIIKNVLSNPNIRFLLLCGTEPKGHFVGQAFLSLMTNGIDADMRIIGAKGVMPFLKNVTKEEVESFKRQITVVDMIGNRNVDDVMNKVEELIAMDPGAFMEKQVVAKKVLLLEADYDDQKQWTPDDKYDDNWFTIALDKQNHRIVAEHYVGYGGQTQLCCKIVGTTAASIAGTIVKHKKITRLYHAAYLGKELQKAEIALKNDLDFVQETDLTVASHHTSMPDVPSTASKGAAYSPIVVRAATIAEAWQKSVAALMNHGHDREVKAPEYSCWSKDAPMFITIEKPMAEPRIHPACLLQRSMADEYAQKIIHGVDPATENEFDYTYFSRLRDYPDVEQRAELRNRGTEHDAEIIAEAVKNGVAVKRLDQVQLAIDTLRKDPTRRSIVLSTWIPIRDSIKFGKREKTSSPCLLSVHPQLVDGKLHMFVVMKTNELFNGFPLNAYGFTLLQKYMADQLGVAVGSYTHFSVSMQIYEDLYESARQVIA